jgi:peptidyl-prolyl isomerase D
MLEVLEIIKNAGNHYFNQQDYVLARRKYRKVGRYLKFFYDRVNFEADINQLQEVEIINFINRAAVELKMGNHLEVILACNKALLIDPQNVKGLFRRGQAHIALKNYENALVDLKLAYQCVPDNQAILEEFERAKKYLMEYRVQERKAYENLFK